MQLTTDVHARAGLLGNPSDGYFGKTISVLIGNYRARVTLTASEKLTLQMHPQNDPVTFDDMAGLADTYGRLGYYGGLRLLQASCKRFAQECATRGIALDGPNFTATYETNIPRQVGMSGSSAIVIATLRSLLKWYNVEDRFEQACFPNIALATEFEELGITAGLQDRVIQTYGGVVYMDFDEALLKGRGYGEYERIDPAKLPRLFIAYVLNPSDSGAFHSDVRRRWNEGDPVVRQAMRTFASFAADGKAALATGDHGAIGAMMDQAFALRRTIFGDPALGPYNLRMTELARRHGLSATTSGSGGAIVGVMGDDSQNAAFAQDLQAEGYRFEQIQVGPEYPWAAVSCQA
jgi:glucuronokinase